MGYSDLGHREVLGRISLALEQQGYSPWVDKLTMKVTTDQESETYRWLSATPAMREWLGNRQAKRLETQEIILRNKKYEASMEVFRDEMRRDQLSQLTLRIGELATRAQNHVDNLLTAEIENNAICYDGSAFFSTTHAEADSGTQSNDIGANITENANAPTVESFEAAFFDIIEQMMTFKDGAGEITNSDLSGLLIMVPVNMFGVAQRTLNDSVISVTGGTRTNSVANLAGFDIELQVNPRLTDDTRFYAFKTNSSNGMAPYLYQEEVAPRVESLVEGSDWTYMQDSLLFGVSKICATGPGLWTHGIRYTFS